MAVRITKDIREANAITHAGAFHADDVFATVILEKVFGDIVLCRVYEVENNHNKEIIVFDIGEGQYDHHQKGGNGVRYNGVPYAACGLIWSQYGRIVVSDIVRKYRLLEMVWSSIDTNLIQGIDAVDNGKMPKCKYPVQCVNISKVIAEFNPCWTSEVDQDTAFLKAVEFARIVFDNAIENAVANAKGMIEVEKYIEENENDEILILPCHIKWQEAIKFSQSDNAKRIAFVIYPSIRGGYCWQTVNYHGMPKKNVPREWWGIRNSPLQILTGIKTASFCHQEGFMGGAETIEDTIEMVKIALSQQN